MSTMQHLQSAVDKGLLTPAAAEALRLHALEQKALSDPDDERFRLVTGFNDIFVVIASILMLTAIY